MSKLPLLPLTLALTIGIIVSSWAGSPPEGGGPSGTSTDEVAAGATNSAASAIADASDAVNSSRPHPQKPDSSDSSTASDTGAASGSTDGVQDDTLYRLKSKDTLGSMLREEGELTSKPRRHERVSEVESTKQLRTTGTDPKFQGSLLHSSVTSIEDVGEKANNQSGNKETEVVPEGDPRFKAKRLVFSQEAANDSTKKKEKSHTQAETSPSPSPSPTASAAASSR